MVENYIHQDDTLMTNYFFKEDQNKEYIHYSAEKRKRKFNNRSLDKINGAFKRYKPNGRVNPKGHRV